MLAKCRIVLSLIALAAAPSVRAADIDDTKLLSQPAISKDHIAFSYANDLWVADRDGRHARRLTTDDGVETTPFFSPDGRTIAFTGHYDGNVDVFVISVNGGVPKRLTWHPGNDVVRGFAPDGTSVLFASQRSVFTNRFSQFFTVSTSGGLPQALPIPNGSKAAYSPDGSRIAYTPLGERFNQWKNYRGGTHSRIWLFDMDDHSVEQIPQPEGRCNDSDPMWIDNKVYFRSDRDGEFNVYSYDTRRKRIERLTSHEDFPVLDASAGDGRIIYEQAGGLHVLNPGNKRSERLRVGVAADLIETRPRFVKGNQYIRSGAISPKGARAVLEFRGEIVTVPAEKGHPRNLTRSPGVHERSPDWSPDGRWIAYFSDESGEYALHVQQQDGKGEVKKFALGGAGFYDLLAWSPDSKKVSYSDNSWALYILDIESGTETKVAQEPTYGPIKTLSHNWSPDSRWLTYTLNAQGLIQTVYVYSLEEGKSHQITDGLSEVSEPVFDADGKHLYFLASTNAGPIKDWFSMSNADMSLSSSIYVAVLDADAPSPLAPESDEEEMPADDKEESAEKEEPAAETEDTGSEEAEEESEKKDEEGTKIDFEGLGQRILALPVPSANYRSLQAGEAGTIFVLKGGDGRGFAAFGGPAELQRFTLKDRKAETVAPGVLGYEVSSDRKKLLFIAQGKWTIAATAGKPQPGKGVLKTDQISVKIDPRAEWEQIFNEAWRINRDYFYATNYHGVDWQAERDKYAAFLSHAATRADVNRIIRWLSSELAVGHHGVGGGDSLSNPERIPGGLLGADYETAEGRYRFKKVFGGLNWNPQLRAPLTAPGVNVQAGEYLLAVDGQDVQASDNVFRFFENTAGRIVELSVGPNADGTDSRTVTVEPIRNESTLRSRDWVEGNIRKVDEATNGRVAYVWLPNTTQAGHTYFKRYFFPQAHKDAIIVDERFNGGGQVADYYIDILRRPFIANWAMRYGDDLETPRIAIQGPKVMLIDETAGSGGDLLPWMFRKFKVGQLIGKRTWGGLVGILGFPVLMDGGGITAPNLAIWTEEGWVVENVGVPPDIEVEQWPKDVIAGHDPQLEKAIEVILKELEANPPKKMERPPFPVRNK